MVVYYSDQPGQDPPFEPRGRCADWASAVGLVHHHLGDDVPSREVSGEGHPVVVLVYAAGGHSYRLEGPPPGPQQ